MGHTRDAEGLCRSARILYWHVHLALMNSLQGEANNPFIDLHLIVYLALRGSLRCALTRRPRSDLASRPGWSGPSRQDDLTSGTAQWLAPTPEHPLCCRCHECLAPNALQDSNVLKSWVQCENLRGMQYEQAMCLTRATASINLLQTMRLGDC